jgi:peptidoglycan-N-acetylglucosamine deacetylase
MNIIVVSMKNRLKYLYAAVILMAVIFVLGVSQSNILEVFSQNKELPIYSVDTKEKTVAITFDCAWGDEDIPSILNTLREQNVKATFFIVGQWAEKFPDTVKYIAEQGNDIANHSYSHLRMGTLEKSKIKSEIAVCGEKLSSISGKKIDLFRAPYGDYNDSVISEAKALGYYSIQWDVDSLDWKPGISQEEIKSRVIKKVRNGSIILFHNDTTHTAVILKDIISALKSEGYGIIPVSEMIYRDKYIMDFDGRQKKTE